MIKRIQDIQGLVRAVLKPLIQPGDVVLDLTAGRGRDTLFLAEHVGEQGKVHAFDIQEIALEETQMLLRKNELNQRVVLHALDHARLLEVVQEPVRAAMFNLGYLPGGSDSNHGIITQSSSTIAALEAVLKLLITGGVIVLTVYRGHAGGKEEAQAVEDFLKNLPRRTYSVLRGEYTNQGEESPYWIMIQKNKGDTE